ncbi:MAG: TIGR02452 family protein, partial [Atopobiaceae bacterium]|nr:TIGR02452 family protein [Atopobiaceae bacterium]
MNRRQQLEAIFVDTEDMISSNITLKEAARASAGATKVYEPDDWPELGAANRTGAVRVSERRSFEAARAIAQEMPGARIAVHNFASPINPGGGVVAGSSAQEESLCRCSTLYDSLNQRRMWDA